MAGRGSIPGEGKEFVFTHSIQTGSGVHTVSYPMSFGGSSIGGKATNVKMITHLQLIPRSRLVEVNLHSPIHLHGVILNNLSTGTTLYFITSLFDLVRRIFMISYSMLSSASNFNSLSCISMGLANQHRIRSTYGLWILTPCRFPRGIHKRLHIFKWQNDGKLQENMEGRIVVCLSYCHEHCWMD
jgi:hypothetical protein